PKTMVLRGGSERNQNGYASDQDHCSTYKGKGPDEDHDFDGQGRNYLAGQMSRYNKYGDKIDQNGTRRQVNGDDSEQDNSNSEGYDSCDKWSQTDRREGASNRDKGRDSDDEDDWQRRQDSLERRRKKRRLLDKHNVLTNVVKSIQGQLKSLDLDDKRDHQPKLESKHLAFLVKFDGVYENFQNFWETF